MAHEQHQHLIDSLL